MLSYGKEGRGSLAAGRAAGRGGGEVGGETPCSLVLFSWPTYPVLS